MINGTTGNVKGVKIYNFSKKNVVLLKWGSVQSINQ